MLGSENGRVSGIERAITNPNSRGGVLGQQQELIRAPSPPGLGSEDAITNAMVFPLVDPFAYPQLEDFEATGQFHALMDEDST